MWLSSLCSSTCSSISSLMSGMCICNSSPQFLLCDAFHQGLIAQDVLLLAGCKKANDYADHQRKWRVLNHLDLLTFCCNCNCTPGCHGFGQTLVGLWRVNGERDQLNTENCQKQCTWDKEPLVIVWFMIAYVAVWLLAKSRHKRSKIRSCSDWSPQCMYECLLHSWIVHTISGAESQGM